MIKAVSEFQPTQALRYKWPTRFPIVFLRVEGANVETLAIISPAELRGVTLRFVLNSFQMTDKIKRNLHACPTAF